MEKQGKFFINISKGFLIGIGAIIPGLSGGTMAIITGVFEELLEATANLILHIRKSIKVIFPVAFGAVAAILTLSPTLRSLKAASSFEITQFFAVVPSVKTEPSVTEAVYKVINYSAD